VRSASRRLLLLWGDLLVEAVESRRDHPGLSAALCRQVESFYAQREISFRVIRVARWRKPYFPPPSDHAFLQLPSQPTAHVRGFFWKSPNGHDFLYYRVSKDDEPLPRQKKFHPKLQAPEWVLFHSQPTDDRYSDIPDREDVYDFLRQRICQFVCVGRNCVSILEKDVTTLQTIVRLSHWEQSLYGKYRMSRLRKAYPRDSSRETQRRYKESALRGVGLRWPRKPSDRLRQWPDALRDIGIVVRMAERTVVGSGRIYRADR